MILCHGSSRRLTELCHEKPLSNRKIVGCTYIILNVLVVSLKKVRSNIFCLTRVSYTGWISFRDLLYDIVPIVNNVYCAPKASQLAPVVKNLPANTGDVRNTDSIPGLGRSPGGGHGNPLQYSWASAVAQLVKNLPAVRETWVWSNWVRMPSCLGFF